MTLARCQAAIWNISEIHAPNNLVAELLKSNQRIDFFSTFFPILDAFVPTSRALILNVMKVVPCQSEHGQIIRRNVCLVVFQKRVC